MKKVLLVLAVSVSSYCAAQSVTPDVIASAGDFFSNAGGSISWTLGEPMGETYQQTGNMVTQGFQQPWDFGMFITGGDPVNAEVYPNPTADVVNLEFGDKTSGQYIIEVYNTLGQQLRSTTFNATPSSRTTISLLDYSDGIYFITVRKADGTENSTFRITKNS
jgi:hypothetical protein